MSSGRVIALGLEYATSGLTTAMQQSMQKMRAGSDRSRIQSELARAQAEAQNQQRETYLHLEAEEVKLQRQAQQERDTRRQQAWERVYQQSAACKLEAATVACANEFIAAKKKFLATYRD